MNELELNFRDAMARVPSPVTIITAMVGGVPTGTTVSAFASLSVDPPMVFFALDNRGGMVQRIRDAKRVGINVLAGDQSEIALGFARLPLRDRFEGLDWRQDHGLPRIEGAVSWLRCEKIQFEPGGDHTIVLATVAEAQAAGDSSLAYHLRQFKDLHPTAG